MEKKSAVLDIPGKFPATRRSPGVSEKFTAQAVRFVLANRDGIINDHTAFPLEDLPDSLREDEETTSTTDTGENGDLISQHLMDAVNTMIDTGDEGK